MQRDRLWRPAIEFNVAECAILALENNDEERCQESPSPIMPATNELIYGGLAFLVGGIVFGHFGDRIGRKKLLMWSLVLMGVAALGTVFGAVFAARVPLKKSLAVLPVGVAMGFVVLLMPLVHEKWAVYTLLMGIGGLSGFFVVPMNALLQHRGHVMLSAGHSIAVQNFNEQLNILFMLALYSLLLWLRLPINYIIVFFGLMVASLMTVFIIWKNANLRAHPELEACIGQEGHGQALTAK